MLSFAPLGAVSATPQDTLDAILADPGFGRYFSDHMAQATWTDGIGWHDGVVKAYTPFTMEPGDAVLHYGQEIFEGLKAYRHADGSIWLFRPEMNARRLQRSAARLDLPELPEEDFLNSVYALVEADRAWVPAADEMSYYIRPFMFAAESFLGVRSARNVTYAVVGGPAGAYFKGGVEPVDIWVTTTYSRAGDGGTGAAKCGGNYASSLIAQREAYEHGCSQVLFTDAATHEWVEELGGMNLFLVTSDGRVMTPPTSGTILAGITRDSVLALAPDLGLTAEERPVSVSEMFAGIAEGDITEAFACGTAAVVNPIRAFRHAIDDRDDDIVLAQAFGPVTAKLRKTIVDIQWGRAGDPYGWMRRVC